MPARTPPETTVAEARQRLGGPDLSDDELVLRCTSPIADVEAMHAAGPAKMYRSGETPMAVLVEELLKRKEFRQITVRAGDKSISFRS